MNEDLDGSKKVIAERNRQQEVVIKMLRQLAHHVEGASKDALTVFLSSGFDVRLTTRTKTQTISEFIRRIGPGDNAGQLLVSVAAVPDAYSYQVRWAPAGTADTASTWTIHSIGRTQPPVTIGNLMPGTAYVFQARALNSGFTDWSDPVTRICT